MPQPYLTLFNPLDLAMGEVVRRVEPVLAAVGFTFSGIVRRIERGYFDDALYYQITSFEADSLTEALERAKDQGWSGVCFECHYLGKEVSVGLFRDDAETVFFFDEDTVLFYDREKDRDLYAEWASLLVRLTNAVDADVCILRRGGVTEAIDAGAVLTVLKQGQLQPYKNPIHVIIRATWFSYDDAAVLDLKRFRVRASTSGYTIVTWLHPDP